MHDAILIIKLETFEPDAKFLCYPDFAPTGGSFGPGPACWNTWSAQTEAQTKAQANEQQAPKGKDPDPRSQGSLLDKFEFAVWLIYI